MSGISDFVFDVKQYNAVGDGMHGDTASIQAAIDSCNAAGGGTVFFPAGTYLSGTLELCSNLRLELSPGATLLGSDNPDSYTPDAICVASANGSLLHGKELQNITITGGGCIDGQGRAFWEDRMCNAVVRAPKQRRPHAMVHFFECQSIRLHDLSLLNSPCYSVWLLGCENVNINNLHLDNPKDGPNTDGLDIDCCRNVTISDCHISAGDDCIALKSDTHRLGRRQACENIVVSNSTLSSSTCGIRIGYEGDGPIRNCTFNNLAIYDTPKALDIISVLPDMNIPFTVIDEGAIIENIRFSNIVAENVGRAIFFWLGREREGDFRGAVRDVTVSNMTARCRLGSFVGSNGNDALQSIAFRDVKLIITGNTQTGQIEIPCVWDGDKLPWGLWCRRLNGLAFENLCIEFNGATGPWQGALRCDNVSDLVCTGFVTQFMPNQSAIPICLENTNWAENVKLQPCKAEM